MQVTDYLIDHQDFNWSGLLADWNWLLPSEFTVWLMNRFGDLFIVLDDGAVHMLDVGGGSLEHVATSRDDFIDKIDKEDNAANWLMIPLVDRLVAAGKTLSPGRCYSYVIPPVLGGSYELNNIITLSIVEHYGVYGSFHRQIKDLPDGTRVKLKVINRNQHD